MTEFEQGKLKEALERAMEAKAKIQTLRKIGGRLDLAAATGIADSEIKLMVIDLSVLLERNAEKDNK